MSENTYITDTDSADFDHLSTQGFTTDEIAKLIYMKKHVVEQTEYREIREQQHRLDFMRWLVEHNRISK